MLWYVGVYSHSKLKILFSLTDGPRKDSQTFLCPNKETLKPHSLLVKKDTKIFNLALKYKI